jgi:transposase InsO family protein
MRGSGRRDRFVGAIVLATWRRGRLDPNSADVTWHIDAWVTDLTYVPTWGGVVYVCFIIDVFSRRFVGWRSATNMRTDMVLDAPEMARW